MPKIKFIVDESVDFPVASHLRDKWFNVTSVSEDFPSIEDIKILDFAFKENRILITNDKDFGSLIFNSCLTYFP